MSATYGSGVYVGLPWWGAMKMHWLENQVVIAFQSDTPLPTDVNAAKDALAKAVGLNEFMKFIQSRGFELTLIDEKLHLFPSPSGHGTTAICSFNVNATGTYH